MKLRSSYMLALGLLMLTAFCGCANAQNLDCSPDQGFGPASTYNQEFGPSDSDDYTEWCSRDSLTNPNFTYLIFQSDGNLVLYAAQEGKALWASNTNHTADGGPYLNGGNVFDLQADSNAVIYDINWNPLWASGTRNLSRNSYLEVLDGYWGIWYTGPWENVRRY